MDDIALQELSPSTLKESPLERVDAVPTVQKGFAEDAERSRSYRTREHIQLATLCWVLFLAGWNDGSAGPLIHRMQEFYHLGYTIVSLIFVFGCVGCLVGAMLNIPLTPKYGLGKLLVLGSCSQAIGYILQAAALPFPVFVLAATINGAGLTMQDSQANGYVASIAENSEAKMGYVQAAYGFGALISPLVSTQFARKRHWSFHYLTSLGVCAINTALLVWVFRGKNQETLHEQIGQTTPRLTNLNPSDKEHETATEKSHFRQIISLKAVHFLGIFLFVYVGTEVTIGGWIVSYMITVRGGGPSAGYVSAGFFGGLALGRLILLPLNKKIGERRVVFLYGLLAIALELIIWLVPSLIGGAVAVAFVGMCLGPMYPIAMNHAGRVFPPHLLTGIIGWVTGIGITGAAVVPFITGALSSKVGIKSLEPVVIAMLVVMLILWAAVPGRRI